MQWLLLGRWNQSLSTWWILVCQLLNLLLRYTYLLNKKYKQGTCSFKTTFFHFSLEWQRTTKPASKVYVTWHFALCCPILYFSHHRLFWKTKIIYTFRFRKEGELWWSSNISKWTEIPTWWSILSGRQCFLHLWCWIWNERGVHYTLYKQGSVQQTNPNMCGAKCRCNFQLIFFWKFFKNTINWFINLSFWRKFQITMKETPSKLNIFSSNQFAKIQHFRIIVCWCANVPWTNWNHWTIDQNF